MKISLIIWLSLELLIAAGLSPGVCILRRAEVRAFGAWHDNPTPETRATLDRERAVTFRHHVVLALVLFAGMATITVPAVRMFSRHRSSQIASSHHAA